MIQLLFLEKMIIIPERREERGEMIEMFTKSFRQRTMKIREDSTELLI